MTNPLLATPSGKVRARALGIPFDGEPGPLNAITDVAGIEVGYATIILGEGPLVVGQGPVRTGVTAVLPRGRSGADKSVFAGGCSLNGNGEMTGFLWLQEAGRVEGPITVTNTHAVGVARDATLRWLVRHGMHERGQLWGLPVAAETYDGYLNDINGFHVTAEHVFQALDAAHGGAVEEGSVGGGTGMICYGFKGGSGTASRRVVCAGGNFMLGAFVQANFGRQAQLTIAGVPVGRLLHTPGSSEDVGSVIGIVATDAPLLPHQLRRLARRCGLGIARSGAVAAHTSGDIFLALSTANATAVDTVGAVQSAEFVPDADITPLFEAVVQATDEAVINALIANDTMTGRDGHTVRALPHAPLTGMLKAFGRISS